jgi:formylglycine-generating enzyme required for sulfatase activity
MLFKLKPHQMKTKTIIFTLSSILGLCIIFGFSIDKKKNKPGEYVFIPMGSTVIGENTMSIDAFWMSDHEVTNQEYRLFLHWLKAESREEAYAICSVKDQKWVELTGEYNKPYAEFYSKHPAYNDYPVLNISHQAAKMYCDWLTEISEDKSHKYRLPTKVEWIYASKGGLEHSAYANGSHLSTTKGQHTCNFKMIGDENIHLDTNGKYIIMDESKEKTNATITSTAISYSPNEYGLYNVCGNAAEMIAEEGIAMGGSYTDTGYDVRIESEQEYNGASPFVGFRPVRVEND